MACPCQNLVWTSGPQGPNSRGGRRGGPMWTRRSPIKWWTRTICWRLRASMVRTLFRIWEIRLIPRENPKFVAQSFELPPCIEAGASRYHGWPGASPWLVCFPTFQREAFVPCPLDRDKFLSVQGSLHLCLDVYMLHHLATVWTCPDKSQSQGSNRTMCAWFCRRS